MANKLVQQQLKNVLRGLNDLDIEKLLSNYEILSNTQFSKNCHMVSYKCYEATMVHKTFTANGYGRTETEASTNCIKNFLEMLMEDESCLSILIKALKKGSESSSNASQPKDHHHMEKNMNVNNTLALNISYAHAPENNTSFENKKEIEILGKNIGNISIIGNHRQSGDGNANVSQLEMDDLLLKMMLEDGSNMGNQNHFRKNLPPQHPNGLDLSGAPGGKSHSNINKGERVAQQTIPNPIPRGSVGGGGESDTLLKNKKALQENTNLHNAAGRFSVDAQKDEREENRHDFRGDSEFHKPRNSFSYKTIEQKQPTMVAQPQVQHSYGSAGESSQKEMSQHSGHGSGSGNKCFCSCADQLSRANLRIESLEKKLKLLADENKILRYLTTDHKDKELKSEISTMTSTNAPTVKSVYDKSIGNYELTPHENYEDMNEFPERDSNSTSTRNDNKRSVSLDAFAKRKTLTEHNINKIPTASNKENANDSFDKKDPKKIIPRLKLEMIPNYHAKFSHTSSTQNPTNVQNVVKTYTQQAIQNPPTGFSQNSFELIGGTGTSSSLAKYIKK